ncbi:hypothetical protein HID58_062960 [Brassica napus]|uniref:Uncharacterized protein n=1 Tax=Brassica napus TaxID=3708 RepID=A0ABQ8A2Y0_BRANA|nr:hypothetical protein HID58_062960 [Brassica napus]
MSRTGQRKMKTRLFGKKEEALILTLISVVQTLLLSSLRKAQGSVEEDGVHIPYDYDLLKKMHFCVSSGKNMIGTLFLNTPRESWCSDHRLFTYGVKILVAAIELSYSPIDTQPSTESNYDSCKIQLISPKEEEDDDEVS